jgi:calcineurin-like phosphoesterase family protein
MANVFLISDLHLSHHNIAVNFLRKDGVAKLRPFSSAEEMDEHIVERWNSVVKPGDKTYVLGDVAMSHRALPIVGRLNGKKCLIKGNHDIHKLSHYQPWFYDIRGSHVLDRFVLTHIPVHPMNLSRFPVNVHGHLHEHVVCQEDGTPDPRYISVCVEQIDYTPVELSVLVSRSQQMRV